MNVKNVCDSAESESAHPGRLVDGLMGVAVEVENGVDDMTRTHSGRLVTIINTLLYFSLQKGLTQSGEQTSTAISDLLADLMHLARHVGIDEAEFTSLINRASMHVEAELDGGEG